MIAWDLGDAPDHVALMAASVRPGPAGPITMIHDSVVLEVDTKKLEGDLKDTLQHFVGQPLDEKVIGELKDALTAQLELQSFSTLTEAEVRRHLNLPDPVRTLQGWDDDPLSD